jgi:hypothetical protein
MACLFHAFTCAQPGLLLQRSHRKLRLCDWHFGLCVHPRVRNTRQQYLFGFVLYLFWQETRMIHDSLLQRIAERLQ